MKDTWQQFLHEARRSRHYKYVQLNSNFYPVNYISLSLFKFKHFLPLRSQFNLSIIGVQLGVILISITILLQVDINDHWMTQDITFNPSIVNIHHLMCSIRTQSPISNPSIIRLHGNLLFKLIMHQKQQPKLESLKPRLGKLENC